jgi:hypothetical protein
MIHNRTYCSFILLTAGAVLQHHLSDAATASVRGGTGSGLDGDDSAVERLNDESSEITNDLILLEDAHPPQQQRQLDASEAEDALRDRYITTDLEARHDRNNRWGVMGSDLVDMNANVADLGEPYDKSKDTAFFFMIPKSGTTTLGSYMTNCVDNLVIGNGVGKIYEGQGSDTLQVVEHTDHNQYINIDVTKRDGLDHGYALGLAESALADVIITGFPVQVASIFNPHNKARMFTLLRHPFQRVVSEFYYVQIADWEPLAYKPWLKNWTLERYVNSDYTPDNFMTRQLVGKASTNIKLTMEDANIAKKILTDKCLIGLTKEYKETLSRFKQYFGWQHDQQCFEDLFKRGGKKNTNQHPDLKRGSRDYNALMEHDKYDLLVWNHAVRLFEEQGKMFAAFQDQ